MKIIYRNGDALAGPENYVCHGCNAQGVMGGGIALQVRNRFPVAYEQYLRAHERDGLALGSVIWADCGSKVIGNAITQEFFGGDKTFRYVSYDAVDSVVKAIDRYVEEGAEVAFPLIGAGLANGSWSVISTIIEAGSVSFQPVVYLFDGTMPNT